MIIESDQQSDNPENLVSTFDWDDQIPFDKTTSTGVLDNGLRYFVKANSVPINRVHLRLVVKVGSVHEQAHERGFAHLIEHLLFRHTESFKDNEIQRFLSSLGAKPGADSNATTYHDYTVFNLMIPVDERTIDYGFSYVDMGVKVLAEMALRAQFTERILEQERRIVIEEYRLNQTSIAKRNALASKAAVSDTPYADKPPIGDFETLKQCKLEHLADFYRRWYKLSNMAVIAVGGFQDPQIVINIIENHFSQSIPSFQLKSNENIKPMNVREALLQTHLPTIPSTLFLNNTPPSRPLAMSRSSEILPNRQYSPPPSARGQDRDIAPLHIFVRK